MSRMGGHLNMTNIDIGTLDYLIQKFGIETMVDVGCGPGGMVDYAKSVGLVVSGIDGDLSVAPDVFHNFDNGVLTIPQTDLAWSVEFLEHVSEEFLDNVFSVFNQCKYVFCTHNEKPGPWHSNCKPNDYWTEKFQQYGFEYDGATTGEIKTHSTMEREFVQKTGNFFINAKGRI